MRKYWGYIPIILAVIAGLFGVDARYFHTTEAVKLQQTIETAAVDTFKAFQRDLDLRTLYDLRDKVAILNQLLKRNPNDTYLKVRRQEIIRQIQRLEEKLNGR